MSRIIAVILIILALHDAIGYRCFRVQLMRQQQLRMSGKIKESFTTYNSAASKESDITSRIRKGLQIKFPDNQAKRVIDSFNRFTIDGKSSYLDRMLGDGQDPHNRQQASCWIENLDSLPRPFHPITDYPWAQKIEEFSSIIIDEFTSYLSKVSSEWEGAKNKDAGEIYGKGWATLGLLDRGLWDSENVKKFPNTVKIICDEKVPACEVFFARQGRQTGILPHSDQNNFIMTYHLGLQVEENKAWIKVGNETQYWSRGKSLIFDTSVFHSTRNDAETDRYVLLIRFWHPNLNENEVKAFQFVFDMLNYASYGDDVLNAYEAHQVYGIGSGVKQLLDIQVTNTETNESVDEVESSSMTRQMRRKLARDQAKRNNRLNN